MRVRIISGNEAGVEREVGQVEGEQMCQFGFAVQIPDLPAEAPAAPEPVVPAAPEPEPEQPKPAEGEPPAARRGPSTRDR